MDSTSADFERYEKGVTDSLLRVPERLEKLEAQIQDKAQTEMALIEKFSSACPINQQSQFRVEIGSLDDKKLKSTLGAQFYNPAVMQAAACTIDAMFYSIPDRQGSVSLNEAIRNYLTDMETLSSGLQGVTALAQIRKVNDMCVVKFPQPGFSEDLRHELFVTTVQGGINSLRGSIPNMAYAFGGVRGPKPERDPETGQIIDWFSDLEPNSVPYLLIENIAPAVSGIDYIKNATVTQALSLYFQVIFALDHAYRAIEFTHYDLHDGNLLMRDISATGMGSVFLIPYTRSDGQTYYVEADRLATIIDFGMAGIRHEGVYYGVPEADRIKRAQFNDRPWPLHDAYKLLMFLIMDAQEGHNQPVVTELTKIFRFFNKSEDPLKLARYTPRGDHSSQWWHRFSLPYIEKTRHYTLDQLLDYMLRNTARSRVVFTAPPPKLKILQCGPCYSFDSVAQAIGATADLPHPQNFFEFYDVGQYVYSQGLERYQAMAREFDYTGARRAWFRQVEDLKEEAQRLRAEALRIDLQTFPILRYGTMKLVQGSYANIYQLIRTLEDLTTQLKVGAWLAISFEDAEVLEFAKTVKTQLRNYQGALCELIADASHNYQLIYEAMSTPEWDAAIYKYPKLRWYADSASDIIGLQNRACTSDVIPFQIPEMRRASARIPTSRRAEPVQPEARRADENFTSPRSHISRPAPSM